MGIGSILTGIVIGVGAVAAAPFTGGGSLLGGATLLSSLAGAGTIAAAAAAAGGTAAALIEKKEKENIEVSNKNSFDNGHKSGEIATINKFAGVLKMQRDRDEFLLLVTQIGVFVAKCDGYFHDKEKEALNDYLAIVNDSPVTPEVIKRAVFDIINSQPSFYSIENATRDFLQGRTTADKNIILKSLGNVIDLIIHADGELNSEEKSFQIKWSQLDFKL